MEPLLALLLAVLVVGGAAWAAWHLQQQRRARYLAFAEQRGWAYDARDPSLVRRFRGEPFGRGGRRQATHVLRGTYDGREALVFDYRFVVQAQDGQQSVPQAFRVVALRLPAALPRLEVTAETPLTRLAGAIAGPALALESEDFNRRYRVRTDDRQLAYEVLHPRTVELLLASPTLNLRLDGADALLWDRLSPSRTPSLALVPERLALLAQLVGGVPSYVWDDRGAPGGRPVEGGGAA